MREKKGKNLEKKKKEAERVEDEGCRQPKRRQKFEMNGMGWIVVEWDG